MPGSFDILENLSLSPNPEVLWYIFLGIVLIFVFYSIFLMYHWFRYGMNILTSLIATALYGGVSLILLLIMLLSFASLVT